MRRLLALTLAFSLGCAHHTTTPDARGPAASAAAEPIERSLIAMSGDLDKVLVQSIVQDHLLTYEICTVHLASLKTNGDVLSFVNSGQADCVNVTPILFDARNVMIVDAIAREYVAQQKSIVEGEVAGHKIAPVFGVILAGAGAINLMDLSGSVWRGSGEYYDRPRSRASLIGGRALGVFYGALAVLFVGAAGAMAFEARRRLNDTKPSTLEVAIAEYQAKRKAQPKEGVPTGKAAFEILVQAMKRATETVDYRVRTL